MSDRISDLAESNIFPVPAV